MKKFIYPLALLLGFSSVATAQKATKLSAAKFNNYGLVYNLPRTQVEVEIVAQRVTQKAGPYFKYAKRYLGIEEVILADKKEWNLTAVNLRTKGIPNKEEEYLVEFRSGSTPYIYLNEEGVLLSINAAPATDSIAYTQPFAQNSSVLDNNDFASVLSEEMILSSSEAKMAELAAKKIYHIRESRLDMLTGNVDQLPGDGDSYKIIMNQLDEQEKALTALFVGTTQVEQEVFDMSVVPTQAIENQVLFRFSKQLGVVDRENLAGDPIYLNLVVTQQGEYPMDKKGKVLKMPTNGLPYCIPGSADISLTYQGKGMASGSFGVAQFGIVYALEPNLFDHKKEPAYATFDPSTGAIKRMGTVVKE